MGGWLVGWLVVGGVRTNPSVDQSSVVNQFNLATPNDHPANNQPVNISVIVPAFNEERGLDASLASVRHAMAAFAWAGLASELIVCDNNSTDATAAIAANAGARVVFEPINQISRARNTGAAHATGEWLLFVDADSHPTPDLCAELAAVIRTGDCVAGGATMSVDAGESIGIRVIVGAWNTISRVTRWAAGSFLFCRTDVFRDAGGFSEELFVAEDVDLSLRLKRIARTSGQRVHILHRHPLRTSARKAHLYTASEMLAFYWRWLTSGGRIMRAAEHCPIWYDGRR